MTAEILHSGLDGLKITLDARLPDNLLADLRDAKFCAKRDHADQVLDCGPLSFTVTGQGARGFTCHTGDHGAVWLIQDPKDPVPNNPAMTVDFRAFGLATGGLQAAEAHFRTCMAALAIPYADTQLRVTRADFAVDFRAPWFEPDRTALIAPPGTGITEYTAGTETTATGARVTGLRAGKVSNRQLAIYDKRTEVLQNGKLGWLEIWNVARRDRGQPDLDLSNRETAQVWRFELRLGVKPLRGTFHLRDWHDLDAMLGDAFADAVGRLRYSIPTRDSNRARWPVHPLWQQFARVVQRDLSDHCSGVLPSDVIAANKAAKMRELDAQLAGLLVTRAAVSDVAEAEFTTFAETHVDALLRQIADHPTPLADRLKRVKGRYQWGA